VPLHCPTHNDAQELTGRHFALLCGIELLEELIDIEVVVVILLFFVLILLRGCPRWWGWWWAWWRR
jgi:hypothetical protein